MQNNLCTKDTPIPNVPVFLICFLGSSDYCSQGAPIVKPKVNFDPNDKMADTADRKCCDAVDVIRHLVQLAMCSERGLSSDQADAVVQLGERLFPVTSSSPGPTSGSGWKTSGGQKREKCNDAVFQVRFKHDSVHCGSCQII